MTYHLALQGQTGAACGRTATGDPVVPLDEANDPDGRHFNCVDCHKVLTSRQRHTTPPET